MKKRFAAFAGTVRRIVRFMLDVWWFVNHWHPVSIKVRSPRMFWRMAMRRQSRFVALDNAIKRIRKEESNSVLDRSDPSNTATSGQGKG